MAPSQSSSPRYRIHAFNNRNAKDGKVILIAQDASFDALLAICTDKLGFQAKRIFTKDGAEIDDVGLIRDDDTVFVSAGENFKGASPVGSVGHNSSADSEVPVYHLAVMGPGAVGKSALTLQYVQGVFVRDYDPTIEDAYRKTIRTTGGKTSILDILDTAGQDDYIALRATYMRERDAFIFVFAVDNRESFDNIRNFYEQLADMHEHNSNKPPIILVGNKADLADSLREVSRADAESMAAEFGAIEYVETSAQSGQNVSHAFSSIVTELVRRSNPKTSPTASPWYKRCTIL